jgi:hypothetical protein
VPCDERRVMLLLGVEVVSLLDSYRPRKQGRSEEIAQLTGLVLWQGRSWRFKFLALPAERISCIFSCGIT